LHQWPSLLDFNLNENNKPLVSKLAWHSSLDRLQQVNIKLKLFQILIVLIIEGITWKWISKIHL